MLNQAFIQSPAGLENGDAVGIGQRTKHIRYEAESQGFTLLELIITIALFAFLVTIAVPGLQETLRNNRLTTRANEFIGALSLARSEAIKHSLRVTLCKSGDGANCTEADDFRQGWMVFIDSNNVATRDENEEIVEVFGAIDGALTMTGNGSVRHYVSYTDGGMTRLANGAFQAGTITLCQDGIARKIIISAAGRVRVTRGTC